MEYFLIVDGAIVMGPVPLPNRWVDRFGVTHDLSTATEPELISYGWLRMIPTNRMVRPIYDAVDSRTYTITGDTVTETVTLKPLVLSDVISQKLQLVTDHRDELLDGTFVFNGDTWFGDQSTRQNVTGLTSAVANGIALPANFVWRNSIGTPIPMSSTAMVALGATMLEWVNTVYGVYYYHTGQINQLSNPELVIAYDHSVGWPASTI